MAIRSGQTSLFALGLRSNRPLLGAVLLTIGLQLAIVYVPVLNTLFKTVPLSAGEVLMCIACGVVILVVVEVEKAMRRRRDAERERP
jgi:Ca2+-transporting ATPase